MALNCDCPKYSLTAGLAANAVCAKNSSSLLHWEKSGTCFVAFQSHVLDDLGACDRFWFIQQNRSHFCSAARSTSNTRHTYVISSPIGYNVDFALNSVRATARKRVVRRFFPCHVLLPKGRGEVILTYAQSQLGTFRGISAGCLGTPDRSEAI